MKRAVVYLRASTNEELQKNSFGTQELAIERFCETHGYEIVSKHAEYVSASKEKQRPAWNAALAELRANPDMVLVSWEVSRISRDLKDWAVIEPLLSRMRFTDLSGDEAPNFLTVSLKLLIGDYESKKLGQRISDGIKRKKHEAEKNGQTWSWGNAHNIALQDRLKGHKANTEKADSFQAQLMIAIKPVMSETLAKKVKYLNNEAHFYTRRGQKWTVGNLHRALNR